MSVTPAQAVDAANEVFGRHPGHRALHAKGILCQGTFTATPEAGRLTRAVHMQAGAVPVRVRVSNGSGAPAAPDYAPDVRGLAVKFELPDGSKTDIVCQSLPWFAFSTPDAFVEFVRSQKRPDMLWRFPAYLARHPRMVGALRVNMPALRVPESYATLPYYGIHAFRWLDGEGGSRYVRYTWVPEAGEARLGPREARRRGRDFLGEELRRRLEAGPVRFGLELQIAGPQDVIEDPAVRWPAERERVPAGTLEITSVEEGGESGVLVFDPTNVVDGIELSDDQVLRFRRQAYSESVNRRTS